MAPRFPFFNALRAFESACKQGSLTGASVELSVTPGAVSRQVAKLEAELGCKLLVRNVRGVEPTAKGAILFNSLTGAFDQIDRTLNEIREDQNVAVLSVFSFVTVALEWLVPRIGAFHRSNPEIDLRLYPMREPNGLFDGTMDVGVWSGPNIWPEVRSDKLFSPIYLPVCSPKLLSAGPPLLRPNDLQHHKIFASRFQLPFWKSWMRVAGVEKLNLDQITMFETSAHAYRAARDGLGIVMGQRLFVCNDLAAGTLCAPFQIAVQDKEPYSLIYLEKNEKDQRIIAFRRWFEVELEEAERVADVITPPSMAVTLMDMPRS